MHIRGNLAQQCLVLPEARPLEYSDPYLAEDRQMSGTGMRQILARKGQRPRIFRKTVSRPYSSDAHLRQRFFRGFGSGLLRTYPSRKQQNQFNCRCKADVGHENKQNGDVLYE